jgi:hypothetical protein
VFSETSSFVANLGQEKNTALEIFTATDLQSFGPEGLG